MTQLSKYCTSENVTMLRSEIRFADYNPRTIGEEEKKTLKRGIKKYGMVGGIVVNKRTGNTLVQGHQRLSVMDELQKYDPVTHDNDYSVRCDVIDLPEKEEKELVILLNNPNAQGQWDYDRLRELMPQIDYKAAGLTDADLSMIGFDFEMPSVGVSDLEASLANSLMPELPQDDEEGLEEEGDGEEEESDDPWFRIPLEYKLLKDRLVVSVNPSEITYNDNGYYLVDVDVLPYFGAAGTEDNGYIFVPDGSGALIDLNNQKTNVTAYTANVFGDDLTKNFMNDKLSEADASLSVKLPVFGLKKDDSAFLAVITDGE